MPWFFYSILTSLFFVGMILCVRRLTNLGFSSKQILFFLCGFVFLGSFVINIASFGNIWHSPQFMVFFLVMLVAGIFSIIGNWADFEGIKRAPNPGYPVAIRNTTILPVALLSVLFFNSSFSFLKFSGAIFIILGIILLVVEKKSSADVKLKSSRWHLFAFLALFSFIILILAIKRATLLTDFSFKEINFFLFLFNFLGFAAFSRKELKDYFKDRIKLKTFLPLVIVASAFSFLANILSIKGFALAPNPGYHEAIKNTNVLFVTLLSIRLFSSRLDKLKIFGVILVILGMIILVI